MQVIVMVVMDVTDTMDITKIMRALITAMRQLMQGKTVSTEVETAPVMQQLHLTGQAVDAAVTVTYTGKVLWQDIIPITAATRQP